MGSTGPGRLQAPRPYFKLCLEDMALVLLLYYRTYTTQLLVGCWFGIDASRVCRIIRLLEPLLAQLMTIDKDRKLSGQEVEELLMDATEQPIERPEKRQKLYYSGKKKRHTMKTEIRVTPQGRIRHVSRSRPGSVHDFRLYKEGKPLKKKCLVYVDSGYQGLQTLHAETEFPYKRRKNKPLETDGKEYNKALSRIRVKVENVFAQIKVFKIMTDRYRNKHKRYNIKFTIIAGITNMKNGFSLA
jgi:hypothetical protein